MFVGQSRGGGGGKYSRVEKVYYRLLRYLCTFAFEFYGIALNPGPGVRIPPCHWFGFPFDQPEQFEAKSILVPVLPVPSPGRPESIPLRDR